MPSAQFQKLENKIREIYLLADPGIVKLLCACTIAHRYPVDPIWLFIIAGSSCGKTELIAALNEVDGYHPISMLTPNTFLSGQQRAGQETSMLQRLKDHKGIFTFKDFTTLLSMHKEARAEIMGQLREIYDGALTKCYGTGVTIKWVGKVSVIAGCTTAIYGNMELHAAMGERFIMYAMNVPDRMDVLDRVNENATNMREKRQTMKDAFCEYLDKYLFRLMPDSLPRLLEDVNYDLKLLANFTTLARSPIERDLHTPSKEIVFKHDPEGPARFYSQIHALAGALMVINDSTMLEKEDHDILFKISLDSIPKMRHIVLRELARYSAVETSGLAIKINYPTGVIARVLEDLNALELVDRKKGASNRNLWSLHTEWRELIQRFEGIKDTHAELVGNNEEEIDVKKYATNEEDLTPAAEHEIITPNLFGLND